jgi:DNA protecting protein DprA
MIERGEERHIPPSDDDPRCSGTERLLDGSHPDNERPDPHSPLSVDALRIAMMWQLHPRTAYRLHARLLDGHSLDSLLGQLDLLEISPRTRVVLDAIPTREDALRLAEKLEQEAISFCMAGQPDFPRELTTIPDPPPYLFLRGACWQRLPGPRVGIVGSRAASRSGKEIARVLARDLALSGCTVVSGLARGVDAEAHRGALEAGGVTLGVLGAGIDVIYPPEHEDLQSRMLEEGGVISEFPPGAPPLRLHFPRRNRILAGLIDVLVVVEGSEKSGARSTVDHALDQGREVMAVPRDPVIPGSELPNRLIFEGARPAISAREVIEAAGGSIAALTAPRSLRESTRFGKRRAAGDAADVADAGIAGDAGNAGIASIARIADNAGRLPLTQRALALMERGSCDLDSMIAELQAPAPAVQAVLAELEVLGWIEREQGRYRRR